MFSKLNCLLVTATCIVSVCTAIRVDWNTNTGPIIPPTPTTTVRPVPPFREPAPVWQDLSNDIPNPNPYIYVPPPPSRPKQRLHTNVNYNGNKGNGNSYGIIVTPQNSNNFYLQNNNSPQVASLSPQYVANVGKKYAAVVPASNKLSPDDKTSYKFQGKYNDKTKKYKAYEKVKYVPHNYYPSLNTSVNTTATAPQLAEEQHLNQFQQLPAENVQIQWSSPFAHHHNTTITPPPTKSYTPSKSYRKHVYAKDKTTLKTKEMLDNFMDKVKKS